MRAGVLTPSCSCHQCLLPFPFRITRAHLLPCPALRTQQARYAAVQHEQAQHAAALKVALLEEQAAAAAESARKRMQEQLDTFRGDAATARQANLHAVCGAFCPPLSFVHHGNYACLPICAVLHSSMPTRPNSRPPFPPCLQVAAHPLYRAGAAAGCSAQGAGRRGRPLPPAGCRLRAAAGSAQGGDGEAGRTQPAALVG